jgi:phosphohistidine phosphatase
MQTQNPGPPRIRTLVIMRHGKAVEPDGLADVERALTPRGRADAEAAGRWLRENGYRPQVVLCSSAVRTRQTWLSAERQCLGQDDGEAPIVRYLDQLYGASLGDVLAVIADVDPDVRTALLVGHNPTVSALTAVLDPFASRIDDDGGHSGGAERDRGQRGGNGRSGGHRADRGGESGPIGLRTSGIAVHQWDGEWSDCGGWVDQEVGSDGVAQAPLAKHHTARA